MGSGGESSLVDKGEKTTKKVIINGKHTKIFIFS